MNEDKGGTTSHGAGDLSGDESTNSESPLINTSQELFQGRREVWIKHDGEMYRLRVTAKSKLYMTK